MAGDRQGPRHTMAMGLDVSTEQNRDRWRSSVGVRACREEGTTREKEGQKRKSAINAPQHQRRASGTKRAGCRGTGRSRKGRRGTTGGAKKQQQNHSSEEQYQQRRVATWGKDKGNGGRGGQEVGPTTGPEGNTPQKQKGAGRGRPVLGTQTGLGRAADLVGPRQRVAGDPKKKGGCREKETGRNRACG